MLETGEKVKAVIFLVLVFGTLIFGWFTGEKQDFTGFDMTATATVTSVDVRTSIETTHGDDGRSEYETVYHYRATYSFVDSQGKEHRDQTDFVKGYKFEKGDQYTVHYNSDTKLSKLELKYGVSNRVRYAAIVVAVLLIAAFIAYFFITRNENRRSGHE